MGGVRLAVAAAAALAALLAVAIVLDVGPFADELSEKEFLARGDEICAEGRERFDEAQSQVAGQTPGEAVALTEELIEIATGELDELRELDVPEGLEASLDRYLRARKRGIELLREGRAAAEDEDIFGYESAQAKLARGPAKRLELARAVGFSECSTLEPDREAVETDARAPSPTGPSAPPTVSNPPTGSG